MGGTVPLHVVAHEAREECSGRLGALGPCARPCKLNGCAATLHLSAPARRAHPAESRSFPSPDHRPHVQGQTLCVRGGALAASNPLPGVGALRALTALVTSCNYGVSA